jgi:hypothetical protein
MLGAGVPRIPSESMERGKPLIPSTTTLSH